MTAQLISADTPVITALRMRPRLADNLSAFGATIWEQPHLPLRDLFRNSELVERFLALAATLPVPDPGSPWHELPAAHLTDHLTQNHRDFFLVTLPDIAGLFRDWDSLDPEIVDLREDFDSFTRGLRQEIESEENHFFPRVLRYEACLRDPAVNPEFNGGSLRVAVAYRRSHTPGLHPDRLRNITERLADTHAASSGNPWAEMLLARLEDFGAQFDQHETLESDTLYPMALEMEKTLYNLSIAGIKAHGAGVTA
jgi:iron-sulfur cluster repair protein YtfE (RIC family)